MAAPTIRPRKGLSRRVMWWRASKLRTFFTSPWGTIGMLATIGIAIYAYNEWGPTILLPLLKGKNVTKWPAPAEANQHVIAILSIIGVIASGVGLFYAWYQIKLANDRILGYRNFYHWMDVLFREIAGGERRFLFFGSTILPGNVSFHNRGEVKKHRTALRELGDTDRGDEFSHVEEVIILVPRFEEYEKTYNDFFRDKFVASVPESRKDDKEWENFVTERRDIARRLQAHLIEGGRVSVRHVSEKLLPVIKGAYFASNGHRVVYAVPLHFASGVNPNGNRDLLRRDQDSTGASSQRKAIMPELIGFTTTDQSIVTAFDEYFQTLLEDSHAGTVSPEMREILFGRAPKADAA